MKERKMFLQRKLRAMYAGEEKYHPEQMPSGKYLPVIGWDTKLITKQGGKQVNEPYLIIIGNDGKPLEVVMFNLKVMIDDRAEIDMIQLQTMVNNLTIMGKMLCEKLTGIHPGEDIEQIQSESGEKRENATAQSI